MSVPKHEKSEEDNKWICDFQFKFKYPRTLCEEGSFHPGSNSGSGDYGSGRSGGGGRDGMINRRPQYSNNSFVIWKS